MHQCARLEKLEDATVEHVVLECEQHDKKNGGDARNLSEMECETNEVKSRMDGVAAWIMWGDKCKDDGCLESIHGENMVRCRL